MSFLSGSPPPDKCANEEWIEMNTDEGLYLTSPHYPGNYEPGTLCTWLFTASSADDHDQNGAYHIRFLNLVLKAGDYLSVGETHGLSPNTTVINTDRWYPPNSAIVHHPKMWVHFESNFYSVGFMLLITRTQQNGNYGIFRYSPNL